MTAIQVRARCDQMLSELCGHERGQLAGHDGTRVISNEMQAKLLLTTGGEQEGLGAWSKWYDEVHAQKI